MRVRIATPAPRGARTGNRVSALRWARRLRELGHRVAVSDGVRDGDDDAPCDVLVALHARKSAPAIRASRARAPGRPVVLAMTGTDLYDDLGVSDVARDAVECAARIVVLQPRAIDALPPGARPRARTIRQSASCPADPLPASHDTFDVCVVGHLRGVKDPLRAAHAARLLPASSRVRVVHLGGVLEPAYAPLAAREVAENPRYVWLGERPRGDTLRALAACRALVVTSRMEGGGNAICEAIACGLPVVSTRIDGAIGTLGDDHPAYFPVGDTRALAALLARCEADAAFLAELRERSARLRPLVDPARERDAWRALLAELFPSPAAP